MQALILAFAMIAYPLALNGAHYDTNASKELFRYTRIIKLEELESPEITNKTLTEIWRLIDLGADPSPIHQEIPVLLFYAIKLGDLRLLKEVASSPNSRNFLLNLQGIFAQSCMKAAISYKQPLMALELVELGFPKQAALEEAIKDHQDQLLCELIWRGADPNFSEGYISPNPLCVSHPAGGHGSWREYRPENIRTSSELFRLGANNRVNAINCDILKAFYALLDTLEELIELAQTKNMSELKTRLKEITFEGEGPLHAAIRLKNKEIFLALLHDKDIDLNPPRDSCISPLMLARFTRQRDMQELLISFGANSLRDIWLFALERWRQRGFFYVDKNLLNPDTWRHIFYLLMRHEFSSLFWWEDPK